METIWNCLPQPFLNKHFKLLVDAETNRMFLPSVQSPISDNNRTVSRIDVFQDTRSHRKAYSSARRWFSFESRPPRLGPMPDQDRDPNYAWLQLVVGNVPSEHRIAHGLTVIHPECCTCCALRHVQCVGPKHIGLAGRREHLRVTTCDREHQTPILATPGIGVPHTRPTVWKVRLCLKLRLHLLGRAISGQQLTPTEISVKRLVQWKVYCFY